MLNETPLRATYHSSGQSRIKMSPEGHRREGAQHHHPRHEAEIGVRFAGPDKLVTGLRFCTAAATAQSRSFLLQRVDNLPVQAFLPQLPIEAFAVPVLPRTARLDIQRTGSQSRRCRATNSGPLPERICSGTPRHSITFDSVSITSCEVSLRATRSAKHSRIYSSIRASIHNNLPSCVRDLARLDQFALGRSWP